MDQSDNRKNRLLTPFLKQSWTISGILISMIAQGMLLSYPSSLLPALKLPDSPIKADLQTLSWISSCIGLGGALGYFLVAFFMDRFGRRKAHLLIMLPGCVAWPLIYFAQSASTLIIARFLSGITAFGSVGLGTVAIGEYTDPKHRGMFLSLKTAVLSMGIMMVHILDNFLSWRVIALVPLILQIGALLLVVACHETPVWSISKGQFESGKASFFWLRGKDEDSLKELDEMMQAQSDRAFKTKNMTFREKIMNFLRKFTRKDFLKPVSVIFLGVMLIEVSGRHFFPAYALDIMGEITSSKNQSFYFTLAFDLIITISSTCSSVLVRMMKRRTLLFSTGFASVAVLGVVCTYMFLAARDVISRDRPWIPIGLFIAFFILVNLGCVPIPLALLGELLPLAHREVGTALGGILLSLSTNLGLQMIPFLLFHLKVYGTFAVLGVLNAVLLTIMYFILPETKDKTLQEIEDYFNQRTKVVNNDNEEERVKMIKERDGNDPIP